ncbi:glucosamine inositolphosphorylceramide transferase family protein [Pedobacter sp. GSP4]|uniref:glucosamine inositolphosphorylceramide transferase family protein n=1 Tax=Pedobacter sp. GSP4 TaxID=3453716 RepID=UPI003EEC4207
MNATVNLFNKIFTADKWNIGFIHQTPEELIKNQKLAPAINWLDEDSIDYAADPFVVNIDNAPRIYYEELDFWKGKGEIMMIDGLDFKNKRKVSGIKPDKIHLSYPYLIEEKDGLYCIPETSETKEIRLYKVDQDHPDQLNQIKVLVSGKAFVDSSLIYHNHKYWLFTSVSGDLDHLYIYHAATIDGQYTGHYQNPIPVEKEFCRAAGNLFKVGESLYRPTQNPVKNYGGSIIINEIELLNEKEFRASHKFEILPDKAYNKGLHNISFADNMIVIDGKRKVLSAIMPLKKLIRNFKNR